MHTKEKIAEIRRRLASVRPSDLTASNLRETAFLLIDIIEDNETQIGELTGALWNSTRNMQDIVKYGEKACNADFKAAIARNRKVLNAKEGE